MQIGMIGIGRMGANMVRRLMRGGHQCVVRDVSAEAVRALEAEGARGSSSLENFLAQLAAPRLVWLMVPAAIVDAQLDELVGKLSPGDIIVDGGGNSYYRDDVDRARRLMAHGIHYVDCGTSGGVLGLERGYCLMIGENPRSCAVSIPSSPPWLPAPDHGPALPDAKSRAAPPSEAICIADPMAPATSSRWSTMELNTA